LDCAVAIADLTFLEQFWQDQSESWMARQMVIDGKVAVWESNSDAAME
jgi:hypothetical protein